MSRTYTFDEIKATLKRAGMNTTLRHMVYCNLPASEPEKVAMCAAGNRIYLRRTPNDTPQAVIVAGCSLDEPGDKTSRVTVWYPDEMSKRPVPGVSADQFTLHLTEGVLFGDQACKVPVMGVTKKSCSYWRETEERDRS